MKSHYDAMVLGSGMAGLGAAIALAGHKKNVLIVDRRGLKGQASRAAGGILDPFLEMRPSHPLLRLTVAAFKNYPKFIRQIEKETGEQSSYLKTGLLYLAKNKSEEKKLKEWFGWQRKFGIPIMWLRGDRLHKRFPQVLSSIDCGLFYPSVGRIQPPKWIRVMKKYAKQKGIHFLEAVSSPKLLAKKGRIQGVTIDDKVFHAPVVVNATGSWSGIEKNLGVKLPVRPARGQVFIVKGKKRRASTIFHSLDGAYIVPWDRDTYLIGSTVEFVGFKPHTTPQGERSVLSRARSMAPQIARLKKIDEYAGLRPFAKDGQPIVGPTSLKGLYLACGFYRSGILLGPYVGKLLAKAIVSGKMPRELAPFQLERFRNQ